MEVPQWLWLVGLLCAAASAGMVCWLTFVYQSNAVKTFGFAWAWLGVVHCVGLLPAAIVARVGWARFLILAVVGGTFPWWGLVLGTVLMLGPLLAGGLWALLLQWVFARRVSGWIAMGVNGVVSLFWIAGLFDLFSWDFPAHFDVVVPLWHFTVTLGVYIGLYWEQPRVWRDGLCVKCRYPLEGLTAGVCPECGTAIAGNRGLASGTAPVHEAGSSVPEGGAGGERNGA